MLVILGLNVRGRGHIPTKGPCIIIANHNSHLDTLVLTTLLPLHLLHRVRPVAAADYFLKNRVMRWFSLNLMGIIPMKRSSINLRDPFVEVSKSLHNQEIILLYPEGTRGEPEQRQELKRGIALLAKKHPDVPIIPVFMHGLGKSLPRNESLFVPFIADVFVGQAFYWQGDRDQFMHKIRSVFAQLASQKQFPDWE